MLGPSLHMQIHSRRDACAAFARRRQVGDGGHGRPSSQHLDFHGNVDVWRRTSGLLGFLNSVNRIFCDMLVRSAVQLPGFQTN